MIVWHKSLSLVSYYECLLLLYLFSYKLFLVANSLEHMVKFFVYLSHYSAFCDFHKRLCVCICVGMYAHMYVLWLSIKAL